MVCIVLGGGNLLANDWDEILIEAESTKAEGFWKEVKIGEAKAMLWDANSSNLSGPVPGQTLSYEFKTGKSKSERYRIGLFSGRSQSAISKKDPGGDPRKIGDTRNNCVYISIYRKNSNVAILKPTRIFTGLTLQSDKVLWWANSFDLSNGGKENWLRPKTAEIDLKQNTEYRLELSGRSDGYLIDKISLKSEGHLADERAHLSPRRGMRDIPNLPRPSADQVDLTEYPLMEVWSKTGVQGGIPTDWKVRKTLEPGDDLAKAVSKMSGRRKSVILLKKGVYHVTEPITMKSNLVIRGEDRKETKIEYRPKSKGSLFEFPRGTQYAGVEDLRMEFCAPGGVQPDHKLYRADKRGIGSGIGFILINGDNNWVKGSILINAGGSPVRVAGKYNTMTGNYVEGAFNKQGGVGYYVVNGSYNLIQGETLKALRHLGVQTRAHHNVVVDCYLETDLNFHLRDHGNNLIEGNTITLPEWHGWSVFCTGGPPWGHLPPGNGNVLVNNYTKHMKYKDRVTGFSLKDVVYTHEGYGDPVVTSIQVPKAGRFYAPAWPSRVLIQGEGVEEGTYLEPDYNAVTSKWIPTLRTLSGAKGELLSRGRNVALRATRGNMTKMEEQVAFYSAFSKSDEDVLSAQLESFQGFGKGSRAGLMMRAGNGGRSPHVSLMLADDASLVMVWRGQNGKPNQGEKVALEMGLLKALTLRLTRKKNSVIGEFSYDGKSWQTIKTVKVPFGRGVLKGIAVCSGGHEVNASFGSVQLK